MQEREPHVIDGQINRRRQSLLALTRDGGTLVSLLTRHVHKERVRTDLGTTAGLLVDWQARYERTMIQHFSK